MHRRACFRLLSSLFETCRGAPPPQPQGPATGLCNVSKQVEEEEEEEVEGVFFLPSLPFYKAPRGRLSDYCCRFLDLQSHQ